MQILSRLEIRNMELLIDSDGEMMVEVDQGDNSNVIFLSWKEAVQLRDWLMANVYLMEKRNAPTGE